MISLSPSELHVFTFMQQVTGARNTCIGSLNSAQYLHFCPHILFYRDRKDVHFFVVLYGDNVHTRVIDHK